MAPLLKVREMMALKVCMVIVYYCKLRSVQVNL